MAFQVALSAKAELLRDVELSLSGEPWHGPSVREALATISATTAISEVPGVHTIAQIVAHIVAWMEEVTDRIGGEIHENPQSGDWIQAGADEWKHLPARMELALGRLRNAMARFPESRLREPVGVTLDRTLGTGVSYEQMLRGLAQHNAYHAGQVMLLRRMFEAGSATLKKA